MIRLSGMCQVNFIKEEPNTLNGSNLVLNAYQSSSLKLVFDAVIWRFHTLVDYVILFIYGCFCCVGCINYGKDLGGMS